MKKLLLIALLMLALVVTVVACTNEPATTDTTAGETTAAPQPNDTTAEPEDADTTAEPADTTVEPADTTAEPVVTTEEPETTTAEPETTAEPLPYVEKEAAGMVAHSFDTFFANGEMYFEQDGGAGDKLTAQENKVAFKTGDACQSIALRGWIGFGQAIDSFGYYVDGYKFVWGEFAQDTEAGVLAAGGENASRFCITVPLTGLASGDHTVGFAVKLADGTVVRLRAELTVTIEKTMWDANKDIVVHQSFDELDLQLNGEKTGAAFDPFNGGAASWNKNIELYDLSTDTLRYWGWIGVKGELGQFGYQINGGTAIYDDAWTHATEQPVIDAAAGAGADNASRMQIMISLQGLTGTNTITVLYKNAEGVAVVLNEFTVVLPGKLPVEVPNHEDVTVVLATYYDGASLMSFTYLGQKVSLDENFLKSITLRSVATSGSKPAWKLKLWVWNTDYDTTIASAPLFVATGKDHEDWADLTIEIPAALGITGDIYYEIEVLSGQMLIHQAEAKFEGLETYLNGVPNGTSYESHMVVGVTGSGNISSVPEMPEPERLSVNKTTFVVGEEILVTAIGDNYDWIGIFSVPATTSGSERWWRLHDNEDEDYLVAPSGVLFDAVTCPANDKEGVIPAGTWYITIIDKDDGVKAVACIEITITEAE